MNTEDNKIIAKFMGYVLQENPEERFFGWYKEPMGTWTKKINLAFHHDWNQLMEVIIKISNMSTENGEETYFPRTFGMLTDDGEYMFRFNRHALFKANTLIEVAYDACVDFIKGYNQQNNNDGEISQNTIK